VCVVRVCRSTEYAFATAFMKQFANSRLLETQRVAIRELVNDARNFEVFSPSHPPHTHNTPHTPYLTHDFIIFSFFSFRSHSRIFVCISLFRVFRLAFRFFRKEISTCKATCTFGILNGIVGTGERHTGEFSCDLSSTFLKKVNVVLLVCLCVYVDCL